MAKLDSNRHKVTAIQEYFIDTSVWLLVYGNLGNYKKEDQRFYTKIFGELLNKNSAILITAQVISEISNVLLKKAFKDWVTEEKLDIHKVNFKSDYVGTNHHVNTIQFITGVIDNILKLKNILKLPDSFNGIDFPAIMSRFKSIDFNDSYYIQLLLERNQSTIVLTNDADFHVVADHVDLYTNKEQKKTVLSMPLT